MGLQTLFGDDAGPPPSAAEGPFAQVAIEQALDKVLDYSVPRRLAGAVRVGQRVKAPLGRGNKPAFGYVVGISPVTQCAATKPLLSIEDERALISPRLLQLAMWMSRYYCSPLGTVLDSVIPGAVRRRIGLDHATMVRRTAPVARVQELIEKTRAPKRRAVLGRLLQLGEQQAIELEKLAGEAGCTPATVRKLSALGLISIASEAQYAAPTGRGEAALLEAEIPQLNPDQKRVFDELRPRVVGGGFSVNLLLGVTGSGKTEIYLRCIRELVSAGRQAIVLVPEIALTSQTVRRFTERFGRVAVLHSGLGATERHRFWRQVEAGEADVVVGARSAVFAPVPRLGLIVVDEEHEASYKQDTSPRYHARDVAVKRAQLENVPVLLGSATPSLETYWRVTCQQQRATLQAQTHAGESEQARNVGAGAADASAPEVAGYHLLRLPCQMRGLQLPHVELLDMRQELRLRRPGIHLLSQRLEHLLRTTVQVGHQAILLLNRRGYANFIYCPSCMHLVKCRYCDVTMTYHRSAGARAQGGSLAEGLHTGQLHCHYCLAVNPLPDKCPECGKKLSLFGLGTQRVEEELARKFPDLRFARVDSDSMHSGRDYERLLGRFAAGELQVMLGTQMIAKGLDYPNVTLVGVISGDTALSLPDFRAAERTFQLITQVAGRAGRGDSPGRVLLQTFLPEDPSIRAAIRQDFEGFAATELQSRREVGLPPYVRMARIILRDQDLDKLHRRAEELASALLAPVAAEGDAVKMKGPMPCAITRIAGYHRFQVVLLSPSAKRLQRVLAAMRQRLHLASGDRVAVDVDPVSLL